GFALSDSRFAPPLLCEEGNTLVRRFRRPDHPSDRFHQYFTVKASVLDKDFTIDPAGHNGACKVGAFNICLESSRIVFGPQCIRVVTDAELIEELRCGMIAGK